MAGFTTEETAQRHTYISDEGDAKFDHEQIAKKMEELAGKRPVTSPNEGKSTTDGEAQDKPVPV